MMITMKKVRPMFTKIVTTAKVYGKDQTGVDGVVVTAFAGTVMPVQKVVSVGANSAGIKVGDLVLVNPKRYSHSQWQDEGSVKEDYVQAVRHTPVYLVPEIMLGGERHFLLETSDIDCVLEEWDGDWEADAEGGGSLSRGVGSNLIV